MASEPTMRKIAMAVIIGMRYVLKCAHAFAPGHLATLSKKSRPKGVWMRMRGSLTSARTFLCCSKHGFYAV